MSYATYLDFRKRLQRENTARDLSNELGLDYNWILRKLEQWDTFGNWTLEELKHRPVNLEELADLLYETYEEV